MFLREDGSRLWITWNVRPWYDGNGEIGGLIIQTEDITEAKAAAENIRLSEEKFRRAFDYSAIGMAIVGLQGEWVQVNNSLCNMLGYTRQELHHLTFQDITHPDDLEADIGLLKELVAGNRDSYQMEKRYFHKDGQIVWILLTVSMVTDSKKAPLFFISQIVDISARKEAEQRLEKYMSSLEEKNKELEQFTYITSHDLREPLNTISSFVDLIKSDCKEEGNNALLEQLDFISESATRMRDLIRELLDFSRLNRQSAHVPVDLKEVVKDVISDLNHSINASKVQIQVEDLPIVTGNKAQLRILFQNLIGNGVKFRNPDSQDSLITIGSVVRDGNNFIYVRDNGIGIDPQHHKKIFLIFQKLHHREQFEGTGIGLASCKKIVQMHGGEISVESETGKGTTFYFTLKE